MSASGLVTTVGNGTATITASTGPTSGSAVVTVMQPVASVEVSPSAETIGFGRTLQPTQHSPALPHNEVTGALATVRASGVWVGTKLAFEFLVLTAARSGEVREARWEEIDLESGTWRVPGERMKSGQPHRVPLSRRALAVLVEARGITDGHGLVFPAVNGMALSAMTMTKLVRELGIEAVPHGFRSSFRDWAAEETDHPHDMIEAALAHVIRNKVEAAYRRTDLFERRHRLMDDWAAYLAGRRANSEAGPGPVIRRVRSGARPGAGLRRCRTKASADRSDEAVQRSLQISRKRAYKPYRIV